MAIIKLIHNPTAGDKSHSKDEIISLLQDNGFSCRYSSTTDRDWKVIESDIDFLVIAGGDGTVRAVGLELLKGKLKDVKRPFAILPMGTANNIAKSIGTTGTLENIIQSWQKAAAKKFDVCTIENKVRKEFFFEGFGVGVFPALIMKMKQIKKKKKMNKEEELHLASRYFHEIILSQQQQFFRLEIDGIEHSGKFLFAEILNIQLIGPSLQLFPAADVSDGLVDVLLVSEEQRDEFANYVMDKINGQVSKGFQTVQAKQVIISGGKSVAHFDGELIKLKTNSPVKIGVRPGALEFLGAEIKNGTR